MDRNGTVLLAGDRRPLRSLLVGVLALAMLMVGVPIVPGAAGADPGGDGGAASASEAFVAGAARHAFTPSPEQLAAGGIFLGGYGIGPTRPATSVQDDVEARALAIGHGDDAMVVVTLDLPGMGNRQMRAIRGAVADATGLEEWAVMVHVTHTHGGADFQGLWGGVNADYRAFVLDRAVTAAVDAVEAMVPAELSVGVVDEPNLHRNRRDSGVTDQTDSNLSVIVARRVDDGSTIGSLTNYVAHPTVLGAVPQMHTDYVGSAVRTVEAELGGVALYVNGAQGDVAPRAPEGPDGFARAVALGEAIAARALDAAAAAEPVPAGLELDHRVVDLDVTNEAFIAAATPPLNAFVPLNDYYEFGDLERPEDFAVETFVTGVRLGDASRAVTMTTMPGELFTRLALQVRAEMGCDAQLLFGTTHDSLGYLIPLDEWTPGEYEEGVSIEQFAGQKVLDAVSDMFEPCPEAVDPNLERPIVFIHGALGSASQFETHAMRFSSNGMPDGYVHAFEYDTLGTDGETSEARYARLDALIDQVLADTGADRVNLAGHSMGTGVSHGYLGSSPARAARVANYVNLDGTSAAAPPGGVRTLAIWAEGREAVDTREIVGATNVRFPEQAHTQVATSAETFAEMYEFFHGVPPETTDVLPEDEVTVAGRAVILGENRGPTNVTLEVWEVDPATGLRVGNVAVAEQFLPQDGSFGPFGLEPGVTYEFAVSQATGLHRHYFQPFERSNHHVRLLTSEPGSLLELFLPSDPASTSLTIQRNREWWGDQDDPARNDVLDIAGTNVALPALMPRDRWIIGAFVLDSGANQQSNLSASVPPFNLFPFITGIDLYLPSSPDGSDTIEIAATPRDADGRTVTLNVPNYPSQGNRMSVQFKDYLEVRLDDPDPEPLPPPFTDVSEGSVHFKAIRALQLRGIVLGITEDRFGPATSVRRDQMASMLARMLELEPVASGPFSDIAGNTHEGAINALAAAGIALGSDGRYHPGATIRRDQVASLIGRALEVEPVPGSRFDDVAPDSVHAGMINALAELGIVLGVDDRNFAPGRDVRRDQLASMLARALVELEA